MLKSFRYWILFGIVLTLTNLGGNNARADDWPQWRGVHRDAKSDESGLLQEWPKDGPRLAWKGTGLGRGYSSVAAADGKIFTMGDVGEPFKGEAIIALDA